MSKRKHKGLERRLALLRGAVIRPLLFHREGGMAMDDRDVRRLIKDGHLIFVRGRNCQRREGEDKWVTVIRPLSPKRFQGQFHRDYNHRDEYASERERVIDSPPGCKPAMAPPPVTGWLGGSVYGSVNITRGVITDEGRAFLAEHGK